MGLDLTIKPFFAYRFLIFDCSHVESEITTQLNRFSQHQYTVHAHESMDLYGINIATSIPHGSDVTLRGNGEGWELM